jgi:NADH-quinone oxidoreductase subunit N
MTDWMEYLQALASPLTLLTLGLLLLMYEVFAEHDSPRVYAANLTVIGLLTALYFSVTGIFAAPTELFGEPGQAPLVVDAFSSVVSVLVLVGATLTALASPVYMRKSGFAGGEYYVLIVFSVLGMQVMAMAADLMTLFLGLETMSVAVYALTGLRRRDARSSEAALKYFLMGAFATAFLLFGIALIYGASGTLQLDRLPEFIRGRPLSLRPMLGLGLVLVILGFAFKVAAVPFHMWAPDVYEGAPTPIAGFMAVCVKTAAFAALIRFIVVALSEAHGYGDAIWVPALRVMAVLTIVVGNVLALVQPSIKRMLAYSSVSHAGYVLIGVVAVAQEESTAGAAVLFYLASYMFMTLGAFGVLTWLEREEGGAVSERFGAYAGAGYRHPALGLAMTLFMIALAGLPPTGGFFGKLYLFSAAIRAGEIPLVLVALLGSVISVYYYLRVVVAFYMRGDDEQVYTGNNPSAQLALGLAIAAFCVIHIGVFPSGWMQMGQAAVAALVPSL